jgi:hypothetical protein
MKFRNRRVTSLVAVALAAGLALSASNSKNDSASGSGGSGGSGGKGSYVFLAPHPRHTSRPARARS